MEECLPWCLRIPGRLGRGGPAATRQVTESVGHELDAKEAAWTCPPAVGAVRVPRKALSCLRCFDWLLFCKEVAAAASFSNLNLARTFRKQEESRQGAKAKHIKRQLSKPTGTRR